MRDLKNKLISSKNTKNTQSRRGKSFGYQVLGFGSGGVAVVPYDADFLVIAGGGGGGHGNGGGGGAGGYLTSTQSFVPSTEYTITVGDGGAGHVGYGTGADGDNSVISGSG